MKPGKEVYDNIEIPAELSDRVNEAIAYADRQKTQKRKKVFVRNKKLFTFVKAMGSLAAAFLICLMIGVNSSYVFAKEAGSIPMIGALARVLTIRSYNEQENSVILTAQVPNIQESAAAAGQASDTVINGRDTNGSDSTYVADINKEIDKIVTAFIAHAKQDMAEYKETFFATGGSEEDWADRTMDVSVTYEVKYQEGPYLSMILRADQCWVSAYEENHYFNLDLENHRDITLEDLLGPDYINICNESIVRQIKEQMAEDENKIYFGYQENRDVWEDEVKFTTITPKTQFYINEKGNPVVCFEKYEIAPGYMGICEFEILRKN